MKIEKINDRQIRCTLTGEDLAKRHINVGELAYGSDKVKELFQDMMQVAEQDFGFEADNIPLVIEAIPVSMDAIILIITKVEDPEELDTRFARFSPENSNSENEFSIEDLRNRIGGGNDIFDLAKRISEGRKRFADMNTSEKEASPVSEPGESETEELSNLIRAFSFHTLDDAIKASESLENIYEGPNTLYKNPEDGSYYLVLKKADNPDSLFNKVCNILSEYAVPCKLVVGMEAYFNEHMEVIIADSALQTLYQVA